ncbi:AAA family ATPase, partial [bacterium]|nr:AAA family ATPase [bacterium]
MIKIDVLELTKILENTPANQNIMLVGQHGIGKSQVLSDFYSKNKKMKMISFFLGQMSDPGDLIGLMQKDTITGRSIFLPPYWWPADSKPIVLFLDELNRARPEILQSVMDLTLNRTLAGRVLPKGSIIVSAINHGDEYQLTDLDPALISRFNIYEFSPTVTDWLTWANKAKLDQRVISFIQQFPDFLDATNEFNNTEQMFSETIEKKPDRRAWSRVANLIKGVDKIDELYIKLIGGIVGISASVNFKKSIKDAAKINVETVLLRFNLKLFQGLKLQDYILVNEQIFHFINNES